MIKIYFQGTYGGYSHLAALSIDPQAKIIHCIRDPKNNCLSMFKNLFEGGLNFTYSQDDLVEYSDGTIASEEQMAKDVVTFLMWSAEPHLESRHRMGFKVIVYLIILTILVYFSMKKIWSRVESEV